MDYEFLSCYTIEELQRLAIECTYRQKGRTTRLVDKYIQELFENNGEWITIMDHTDLPTENEYRLRMAKQLFDKIIKRLKFEHNYGKDNKKLSIEHRITDDCTETLFQAKLELNNDDNKEFTNAVFQELYNRVKK